MRDRRVASKKNWSRGVTGAHTATKATRTKADRRKSRKSQRAARKGNR